VFFSMRLFVKVVMEFLNSRCENVMEFVCVFFSRFVGCDSVFSRVFSYRRICFFGVIADVLLLRLVNLFRLQSLYSRMCVEIISL